MPEQGPECCDGGPELWVGGEMLQDTEGWKEAVKAGTCVLSQNFLFSLFSGYTNPRYPTRPKDIHLENLRTLFCWMTDGNVHRVLLTIVL